MSEPEWRDVSPETLGLPVKGRAVILCIAGGLLLGVLSIIGLKIKPVGLAIGSFAFFIGIGMLLRMRKKKSNVNIKSTLIVTIAGFLMMLTHPRFGPAVAFAGYFLITGSIGLVVLGICKAIKLAWDLGNRAV